MIAPIIIRIISTYVENTSSIVPSLGCVKDHLHIRGEHFCLLQPQLHFVGSSPHTWRTQWMVKEGLLPEGIISTYVENTNLNLWRRSLSRDHLHIRGEHSYEQMQGAYQKGSSPHTWRTLRIKFRYSLGLRIISTYVENTHQKEFQQLF